MFKQPKALQLNPFTTLDSIKLVDVPKVVDAPRKSYLYPNTVPQVIAPISESITNKKRP